MTRILVLGATGRTGAAILRALPAGAQATAALRAPADAGRLAATGVSPHRVVVDVFEPGSLMEALRGTQVVVNAIRLREEIAPSELVALHDRLVLASTRVNGEPVRIVTVGGSGALRLRAGKRFWQVPAFPRPTLPRGRAHAALRDHLEAGNAGRAWAYLIPPPFYDPDGPATGRWEHVAPAGDETAFTTRAVSYADFGAAVAEVASGTGTGTRLIAWPS
ncbi:NAD(P)H-binding protein [Saccharomonospora sp. NPDC006951]